VSHLLHLLSEQASPWALRHRWSVSCARSLRFRGPVRARRDRSPGRRLRRPARPRLARPHARRRRGRPISRSQRVHAGGYAFPSGHATQAAAMWGPWPSCSRFSSLAGPASRSLDRSSPRRRAGRTFPHVPRRPLAQRRLRRWALGSLRLFALLMARSYLLHGQRRPVEALRQPIEGASSANHATSTD